MVTMLMEVLRVMCARASSSRLFHGTLWATLCGLLVLAPSLRARPTSDTWRALRTHDGITSWESERPGRPLSAYRARMLLDADPWQPLAVLEDVARACEWTSHCVEMKTLRWLSERELVVYARLDAPWPVRDRDVLVHIRVQYGAADDVLLSIASRPEPEKSELPGVVRMPYFRAHYRFRALAEQRTEVEYEIEVDPGGTLPGWLKAMIARDLAHDTLADLRSRVRWAGERGLYRERVTLLAARARLHSSLSPLYLISR